jgi:hypothetical protein
VPDACDRGEPMNIALMVVNLATVKSGSVPLLRRWVVG